MMDAAMERDAVASLATEPAFNNRHRTFELIERDGRRCILYRQRAGRPYPPEVLEAARTVRDHPCRYLPAIYEVHEDRIIGEYLEGFAPLGKAGVTSSVWRGAYFRAKRRGRFRRRHLRRYLRSVAESFDAFIGQLREVGRYLEAHGLWHEDVIPQNVMWHPERREMRLVDIAAMFPRRLVDAGARPPYTRRRQRGVFRLDYSVDVEYLRRNFLQDLDPWWAVLLRKAGWDRRD